jgi:ABC-type dipeptide/oligopeptide/nickel transport system ATPase subunit
MTQQSETWVFEDRPAARVATPLFLGMVGPSGTGKTFSSLRLATGMQRVTGGEIFFIDTESNRSLHYAPLPGQKADPARGTFNFRQVQLTAPYGSLRYLAAIEHCAKQGAKIIIVDSMSHEHDGVGGVLEQHGSEVKRLAKEMSTTENAVKMSAWGVPKSNRRRLINTLLTELKVSGIFNFRAQEKIKIASKQEKKAGEEAISQLGYCAIGGKEFLFEMMMKFVLLPGARGLPTWKSDMPGEQEMMKIPEQFLHIFEKSAQLSEDIGQQLAEWAAGGDVKTPTDAEVAAGVAAASAAKSPEELEAVIESFKGKPWTKPQRKALNEAVNARKSALSAAA